MKKKRIGCLNVLLRVLWLPVQIEPSGRTQFSFLGELLIDYESMLSYSKYSVYRQYLFDSSSTVLSEIEKVDVISFSVDLKPRGD